MKQLLKLVVMLAVFAMTASAQLTRGFISGTVTDSTGAVVPRAKISLHEQTTGVRHAGISNEAGVYRFPALESGIYTLVVQKDGFETARLEKIELSTAQEVVLNRVLRVAGTATVISVEASATG